MRYTDVKVGMRAVYRGEAGREVEVVVTAVSFEPPVWTGVRYEPAVSVVPVYGGARFATPAAFLMALEPVTA